MDKEAVTLIGVGAVLTAILAGFIVLGIVLPNYYDGWQLEAVRTGHAEYYLTTNQPPERAWRWKARSH